MEGGELDFNKYVRKQHFRGFIVDGRIITPGFLSLPDPDEPFFMYANTIQANCRTRSPLLFASSPLGCISDGRVGLHKAMAQMALLENTNGHVG